MLVRRHEGALRGFLARLCGDPSIADDLAQETFVRAWTNAGRFSGRSAWRTWLFGIGWRAFLTDRRAEKARKRIGTDPWRLVASDEAQAAMIRDAILQLPPAERAAVILCLGQGFTHEEAAESLGAPLGSLKSRVKRGRERLMAMLGEGE